MEKQAGAVMSVFIKKYITPVIKLVDELEIKLPQRISLEWYDNAIQISSENTNYTIFRRSDE